MICNAISRIQWYVMRFQYFLKKTLKLHDIIANNIEIIKYIKMIENLMKHGNKCENSMFVIYVLLLELIFKINNFRVPHFPAQNCSRNFWKYAKIPKRPLTIIYKLNYPPNIKVYMYIVYIHFCDVYLEDRNSKLKNI